MDGIVKAHNKALLRKEEEKTGQDEDKKCNCRNKEKCPVKNKCLTEGVVYKATVNYGNALQERKQYVGMAGSTFKSRLTSHKTTFKHDRYRNETELSKFIWSLKDKDIRHDVTWDITDRAHTYKPGNITCNLCLAEKLQILTNNNLLNKKSELLNKAIYQTTAYILESQLQNFNSELWGHFSVFQLAIINEPNIHGTSFIEIIGGDCNYCFYYISICSDNTLIIIIWIISLKLASRFKLKHDLFSDTSQSAIRCPKLFPPRMSLNRGPTVYRLTNGHFDDVHLQLIIEIVTTSYDDKNF
eukprot:sb/3467383/